MMATFLPVLVSGGSGRKSLHHLTEVQTRDPVNKVGGPARREVREKRDQRVGNDLGTHRAFGVLVLSTIGS